jgi:GNAT superfamily N-acetyltransferase
MLYAAQYGWDHGFEAYVAETIGEFGRGYRAQLDRLWMAELDDRLVGSIGIVGREDEAQLRWVLVHPEARGHGLGRRLLEEALAFCRQAGYRSVFLWTVHVLTPAATLYRSVGFEKTEVKPAKPMFGAMLAEERYDLTL